MKRDELIITDWKPELSSKFSELNIGWLMHYFSIEPVDEFVLYHPEEAIIEQGGVILFAILNNEIIGTVALRKQTAGIFELTKMTIREDHRGKGFGERLCLAAINKACEMRIKKLVLYSSTRLPEAIPLYHKLGFREIIKEEGIYDRCNIKMEIDIDRPMIIPARELHASQISRIGRISFSDAFGGYFKIKDDLINYLDYTYNPARVAISLPKANNSFFLAYLNGQAIGFIKLKKRSLNKLYDQEAQAELQKIYVLTPFHGTGASDELMKVGLQLAKSINSSLIWLDVIIENERAIRFYQKYGFVICGHHEFRIGSQIFNYHVMSKSLADEKIRRELFYDFPQK
jgi:ribosomal protein S18 acetylase RimI-like enzyme